MAAGEVEAEEGFVACGCGEEVETVIQDGREFGYFCGMHGVVLEEVAAEDVDGFLLG